jgi:endonuclease/exonuclease/phosphatase (EEP) superfamily protein YafD
MRDTVFCVLSVLISLVLVVLSLRYVTDFWLLSFVYSFQVHFALAAAAGVVVALAFKRHWYGFLLLAVALFLAGHGVVMLREFDAGNADPKAPTLFRLISFNIENENFENSARIADMVIASNADVVNILEAEPLLAELPRLSQTYPYHVGCGAGVDECDTLVLSKRPFVEQHVSSLGQLWKNRLTQTAIDFNGTKISFLAAHLAKPYFDEFQASELDDLRTIVSQIQGPLVLAGDFNSSTLAPGIQHFLRNAGFKSVFPEPATWPTRAGDFGISIDHVLARPPLQLKSLTRIKDSLGSNHFGLMAEFNIGE